MAHHEELAPAAFVHEGALSVAINVVRKLDEKHIVDETAHVDVPGVRVMRANEG